MSIKIKLLSFVSIILFLFISIAAFSSTVQYTYDDLNRLIKAEYDDGTVIDYTYDATGNRITKELGLENFCKGDFDRDTDIDGSDLATYAAGGTTGVSPGELANNFGKAVCP